MLGKLLSCTLLLLTALEPLLAHPVTHSDMPYAGPAGGSAEEDQLINPGELMYPPAPAYLPWGAAGINYPSLPRGDIREAGVRADRSFLSNQAMEALMGKASLDALSRFLGGHKQYHKRGSNTECFWKYCV